MNEVGDFLSLLNRIQIKGFRNAERLLKKISECKWAIMFNRVCLRLRNPRTQDTDFTIKFCITLLETEMKDKCIHLENLTSELVACQKDFI